MKPSRRPLRTRLRHDADGAVGGSSLLQLTIVLVVLGVVAFDLIALGVTAFQVDDRARKVAAAAAETYAAEDSAGAARQTAEESAASLGAELAAFEIDEDADRVVVRMRRRAATLVAHRLFPERTVLTGSARAGWR